jgi:restriction system protein
LLAGRQACGRFGRSIGTTSYFTKPAEEFAKRHEYKVVLIDGDLLARLMIHHSVGVRIVETMHYKKIDDEFFPDE